MKCFLEWGPRMPLQRFQRGVWSLVLVDVVWVITERSSECILYSILHDRIH